MRIPFYYCLVTDDAERQRYIQNYQLRSGNKLSLRYLRHAFVFQFYLGPKPVAGFIFNIRERGPLRYAGFLDRQTWRLILDAEGLYESDLLEVSGFYALKEVPWWRMPWVYGTLFWQMYRYARRYQKTYLLGGGFEKKLNLLWQLVFNRTIMHGDVRSELRATIRHKTAPLKICAVRVSQLPYRAPLAVLNRYAVQLPLRYVRRAWTRWFGLPTATPDVTVARRRAVRPQRQNRQPARLPTSTVANRQRRKPKPPKSDNLAK